LFGEGGVVGLFFGGDGGPDGEAHRSAFSG
jgi:hypothetical protein